jgi:hypothetical protein
MPCAPRCGQILAEIRSAGSRVLFLRVRIRSEETNLDTGTAYGRPRPSYNATLTLHSEERLAASDRGVVMFRRLLRQQIEAVQAGRDPLGVAFDTACATVQVEAGNFMLEPAG